MQDGNTSNVIKMWSVVQNKELLECCREQKRQTKKSIIIKKYLGSMLGKVVSANNISAFSFNGYAQSVVKNEALVSKLRYLKAHVAVSRWFGSVGA